MVTIMILVMVSEDDEDLGQCLVETVERIKGDILCLCVASLVLRAVWLRTREGDEVNREVHYTTGCVRAMRDQVMARVDWRGCTDGHVSTCGAEAN